MNSPSQNTSLLIETQYLPRVSAFVTMQSFSSIVINGEENFRKSTLRNRCTIVNANGPLMLTVPVVGGRGVKSETKDVRIANDGSWRRDHWRSMRAAYGKSSFFIFYEEKFRKIYEKEFMFLVDFNTELLRLCFEILHWKKEITQPVSPQQSKYDSHRSHSPNANHQSLNLPPYHQVFESKLGFIPDVSIADLIFNLGNEVSQYLSEVGKS